jgi:3-hydroxyacyl-CoA dehydrogenase/enoyl-CoA hydratase/3-hydroxybutyryl-CoA epimerase
MTNPSTETTADAAADPKPKGGQAPKTLSLEVTPEGVAIITYDVPGERVNTVRADFVDQFLTVIDEIEQNPDIRAAVLRSGKPDSFIVGADIDMLKALGSVDDGIAMCRRGHQTVARLAGSSKPVVAAIHGNALGGGFEVALACQARVLSDSPKTLLGLPEVKLGLLPGLNGLQRLAMIAGFQVALDHGLTGKNMRAKKARKLGVASDVVPEPILYQVAAKLALALAEAEPQAKRRKSWRPSVAGLTRFALEGNPLGRSVLFKKAREMVMKNTGGHYPAPCRIIEVLERLAAEGFEASKEVEARVFGELVMTDVSASLMGLFFATTALKKDTGVDNPKVQPRQVDKIGVLGAGLMGAGITSVSIKAGVHVRLKDVDVSSVGRGMKHVADLLDKKVRRKHLTKTERAAQLARVSATTDYSGMGTAPVVIEAVFEDLALKHQMLRDVEAACGTDVIFASNTSSIPITRIAEASSAPQNVVGMHNFSPVEKMPLLEVIRTDQTSDEVVATVVAIGKRQGKTVIVVRVGVGFFTSRILGPYMNEASYILTEGASVEGIDRALMAWGWPVGPITLLDEVGIDVAAHVGPIMLEAFGDRMAPPPTVTRLVDDGRKGRKNERGFYRYGAAVKGKPKQVDESVYEILGLPVPDPKADSPVPIGEIQQRCSLQLINEAMHCWGDGILRCPRDGDIGAIFGLGFPPFLGGPFRHVDNIGADRIVAQIEVYRDRFGDRWTPAPVLLEMAEKGQRFYG